MSFSTAAADRATGDLHARHPLRTASGSNAAAVTSTSTGSSSNHSSRTTLPSGNNEPANVHYLHPLSASETKKLRRSASSLTRSVELRYSLFAVAAFLVLGLFLGYVLLHHQRRKVALHVMTNPWAHGGAVLRGRVGYTHHFYSGSPRFVTAVLPSVVNPDGRAKRLKAIQDTWGPYARAIYVVHNTTTEFPDANKHHAVLTLDGHKLPYDSYSFPQALELPEDMSVEEGIPRLFHTIQTVHEQVNPDFAFFVNDHTFVIPEHLCKFLESKDPADDMYDGHAMRSSTGGATKDDNSKADSIFNSGAAGYLLSRSTMEKIVQKYKAKDSACYVDPNSMSHQSKWLQGNPGMVLLDCLNSINVHATDTRSQKKWHRFHAFPITRMVSGDIDDWYKNKHGGMDGLLDFDTSYESVVTGQDCCSKTTVSFHYVEAMEARALFNIRSTLLKNPQIPDHELITLMEAEWPTKKRAIGHYSKGLPSTAGLTTTTTTTSTGNKDNNNKEDIEKNKLNWHDLIHVLRKISNRSTQRDC